MDILRDLGLLGGGMQGPLQFDVTLVLISFLLAFIMGQAAAWVYVYTHQGLSYSRAFVQSIVLLSIIVAMAMMVIGSNIVIAFGLIGALSVIRFRNILKDTRDTAFIFYALINGMSAGTQNYLLGIVGGSLILLVILYLYWTSFGSLSLSDGFLRLHLHEGGTTTRTIHDLLLRYCRSMQLVSERFTEQGHGELAYRLEMRDPRRGDELVASLRKLNGVANVTFVLQEEQTEI